MKDLISQSQLSRTLNVPEPRLRRALLAHRVKPDLIISGRFRMFDPARVSEIAALLRSGNTTPEVVS